MKPTKKKFDKSKSAFWNPDSVGKAHEGTFNGFVQSSPNSETPDQPLALIGDLKVNVTAGLKQFFGEHFAKLKKGKSKVRLVFLGKVPTSTKGRKVKKFQTYIDGKEWVGSGGQDKPVSEEELKSFFGVKK